MLYNTNVHVHEKYDVKSKIYINYHKKFRRQSHGHFT